MTVRTERVIEVPAPLEDVWAFLADHRKRTRLISVVEDVECKDETHAIWHLSLPLPVNRTVALETEDTVRNRPEHIEFVGSSAAIRVNSIHDLESTDTGTRLTNQFVIESKFPGIERSFERNLDDELDDLKAVLCSELDTV